MRHVARKRFKAADFSVPDATDEERKIARKLAFHYKMLAKSDSMYRKPFDERFPLEAQRVFDNFLQAARVVINSEADPKLWIYAQFEEMKWTKTIPFPSQLHSANAPLRYTAYMAKRKKRDDKVIKKGDHMHEGFELEEAKLARMAAKMGWSERKTLKVMKREFSSAFIAAHKVLNQ